MIQRAPCKGRARRPTVRALLSSLLAKRFAVPALALLGCLATLPAASSGLIADDYFHSLILNNPGGLRGVPRGGLESLFIWSSGAPEDTYELMDQGLVPWWSNPRMRMAYFRPISAATHVLDHLAWPDSPALMHLHSTLWFGLALALVWVVYRRLIGSRAGLWVAGLALGMFALDDAHVMTIGWIANRNALIALTLAAAAFALHDRARAGGDRRRHLASALVLCLALLAGEAALAICAYFFAYALFCDPHGRRAGLLALWPQATVGLTWAFFYRAAGFGSSGSGLVIDPGGAPLHYLSLLPERVPILLLAQLGFPPSDPWEFYEFLSPQLGLAILAWACSFLALTGWALWPLLRREPTARMWALGMLLSTLPVSAQFPHDRLLLFIGFGAMPLVALYLDQWLAPAPVRRGAARVAAAIVGGLFITFHLVLGPLWFPFRMRAPEDVARMTAPFDQAVDDSPAIRGKTVIVINPPHDGLVAYLQTKRAVEGRPRPAHVRWLALGAHGLEVTRLAPNRLRVKPLRGYLAMPIERMQRGLQPPMPVGHRVELTDFRAQVVETTADGRPLTVDVELGAPLEDPRYVLLHCEGNRILPFKPPPVGQRVSFDPIDFQSLLPP